MTRSPNRYTKDQIHLRKCLKSLFDFYYGAISNKEHFYLTPQTLAPQIKALLKNVFECEFQYDLNEDSERFYVENFAKQISPKDIKTGHVDREVDIFESNLSVYISSAELKKLPELIELLKRDLENHKSHIFLLSREIKGIECSFAIPDSSRGGRYFGILPGDDCEFFDFPKDLNWNQIDKHKKAVEKATKYLKRKCYYLTDQYAIISSYTRYFEVSAITAFARNLLGLASRIKDKGPNNYVPSIDNLGQRRKISLFDLIKSIFVHYHVEHIDFRHVIKCQCSNCNKLTVETRTGQKQFCSPNCRNKSGNEKEAPEICKCRTRQNKYLERYIQRLSHENHSTPSSVLKEECSDCSLSEIKGGQCPALKTKNPFLI